MKRIDELNTRLAQEFGRTDQGEPRFKWVHSTKIHYIAGSEYTPDGLWCPRGTWAKHPYALLYGNRWMLAAWAPPELSEAQWYQRFRGEFPWPANGEFHPIDAAVLPPGVVPDERLNLFYIQQLPKELGMAYEAKLKLAQDTVAAVRAQEQRELEAAVDDAFPAFGSIPKDQLSPGMRYSMERVKHVSFPTPQTEKETVCH